MLEGFVSTAAFMTNPIIDDSSTQSPAMHDCNSVV